MDTYNPIDYSLERFEGEQFNDMTSEAAAASLRYYQEAFQLDIEKLASGDEVEWHKTKQYPPSFVMMLEQLMCKIYDKDNNSGEILH
jgi:hypothetical protein